MEAFLVHLARDRNLGAVSQNQALAALLFLYGEVLAIPLEKQGRLVRATRPFRVPVVLTPREVASLLSELSGPGRDRRAPLPAALIAELQLWLATVRRQHERDLAEGAGCVELPNAMRRKSPNAHREWPWQWVLPATRTYLHPPTGERRRHHRSVLPLGFLMRPLLNGGTLIWNDGSSSKGGFSSFSDLSLLSFLEVEVNESAGEVGRIVDG